MADVFDIDSSGYHGRSRDDYNHRNSGGWIPVDNSSRKDPRLNRRDDSRKYSPAESPRRSPQRQSKAATQAQMYNQQISHSQQYQQQAPPPPMYSDYNSGYGAPATYNYQHQQTYQHAQNNSNYAQYTQQSSYTQQQGYNTGHHQPGPPGDEYSNSWGTVPAYPNMSHPAAPPPVPRPPAVTSATHTSDSKNDDLKKEAIAQEMKQQRATLIKQRDEYLRKASVLRRELEKLRMQKHELLSDKSPPRDAQRILRENAKLQLEIQNKLKSINNVVDMLSGIIGDGLKTGDDDLKTISSDSSPKRSRKHTEGSDSETAEVRSAKGKSRERDTKEEEWPQYNYIHYDPELHWCRVCDVFPRSAKDFLNHMHSAEHRQVTQEHQLVDTPWHKLPSDPELPSYKGAPVKRVPIKGLQFFISATSWYCKLCDVWIGDLHCASLHLKSKNHSHNYSNFVEQNPHWETNWLKDREKAYARCAKAKAESGLVPPAPEPPVIKEKIDKKLKSLKDKNSVFLEPPKDKKRKKKSKKRKKNSSDSSSSSSSSDSSSEDESDKAKSIRVAMRNKMRMQAQLILNEEIGGKLEALRGLVEEKRNQVIPPPPPPPKEEKPPGPSDSNVEDNIINQWMTVTTNNDKHILDNLKGRLKQRQEADKEKSIEAAAEQRRREREREERELKEMREREQRELEQKMREEKEKEERERQEREQIKERERNRRKRRSESRSPSERGRSRDRFSRGSSRSRGRSRSRSVGRRRYEKPRSPPERYYREEKRDSRSPEFRPPRRREKDYSDDEYDYKKGNSKRLVSTLSSSRKLPFIGRMPLFKKRGDGEEKEIKKEDYEIRLSKFEPGHTARGFIPEPGVVHIPKLYTAPEHMPPIQPAISAENPPPPPKIIPEPPQISETAPPPPIINDVITTIVEESTAAEVQDMELDEAAAPLPPGVPIAEGKPLAKPAGNHLPRDFQDALNIIFPGDQAADPNLMMQYQYQMGYGMMYPGMSMYDYAEPPEETELMPEDKDALAQTKRADEKAERDNAPPGVDDKEDLAMLGIDAEDMAAQTI